jgi:hypothetical protein
MQSPEEIAMHRAYDAVNKPFPWQKPGKHRQALPAVGLPRRKVKRQLSPQMKAKLAAAIEQMKANTAKLKEMADANGLAPTGDLGDSAGDHLTSDI